MPHYLVTGGAGFVGSVLTRQLESTGHDVVVLDDFSTGSRDALKGVAARVYHGNPELATSIPLDRLDGIFFVDAPSSSPMYRDRPDLVGQALNGFLAHLELARRWGCRLVYASSSSVYIGNPLPWREDMPLFAKDYYSEVRIGMERLARVHSELYGTRTIGLRPFSIYGPNERPKGRYANLLSQAVWCALDGKSFVVYGDGSQRRDWIHVDDIVVALGRAMAAPEWVKCEVVNAGTGFATELRAALTMLGSSLDPLGLQLSWTNVPNPVRNYIDATQADTTKAQSLLGFTAAITLERGVALIARAYVEQAGRLKEDGHVAAH